MLHLAIRSPAIGCLVSPRAEYILATSLKFEAGVATVTAPVAVQRGSVRSKFRARSTAVLESIWASVLKNILIAVVFRGVTGSASRRLLQADNASRGAERINS